MQNNRYKPTRHQELIGRAAMIVAGLVMAAAGIGLVRICVRFEAGLADVNARADARYLLLLLVPAGFLEIVAVIFIVLAVLPDREKPYGPPRGFVLVSRVFDLFWKIAEGIMNVISW